MNPLAPILVELSGVPLTSAQSRTTLDDHQGDKHEESGVCLALLWPGVLSTQAQTLSSATFAQRTAGLQRQEGFLPLYLDPAKNRLLMEVRLNEEMLYFVTVSKGVGSVELGVDRVAQREALEAMMILGAHPQATPEVRALTLNHLTRLRDSLGHRTETEATAAAHMRQAERDLAKYLENPAAYPVKSSAPQQPPGAPLGTRLQD